MACKHKFVNIGHCPICCIKKNPDLYCEKCKKTIEERYPELKEENIYGNLPIEQRNSLLDRLRR